MEVKLVSKQSNELLNKYDSVSYAAVVNIYTLAQKHGQLVLRDFNPDNDDHLFFLHSALIVKDLLGYQLKLHCSIWKWLKTNWKLRKTGIRIQRNWKKFSGDAIYIRDLAEFMCPLFDELQIPTVTYGEIYHAYYEKGYDPNA